MDKRLKQDGAVVEEINKTLLLTARHEIFVVLCFVTNTPSRHTVSNSHKTSIDYKRQQKITLTHSHTHSNHTNSPTYRQSKIESLMNTDTQKQILWDNLTTRKIITDEHTHANRYPQTYSNWKTNTNTNRVSLTHQDDERSSIKLDVDTHRKKQDPQG